MLLLFLLFYVSMPCSIGNAAAVVIVIAVVVGFCCSLNPYGIVFAVENCSSVVQSLLRVSRFPRRQRESQNELY
jgi:ABC-type transport system involved in cytochrome bd biosynthesis fused ATPase/permease subunit